MSDLWFPKDKEYGDFYHGYINTLSGGDVHQILEQQLVDVPFWFEGVSEAQWHFRYAEGKWSVKEVLGHIVDAERVMAYRAFRISRGDRTPLPGFDENPYVEAAQFDRLSGAALVSDFQVVRASSLSLRRGMTDEMASQMGTASGFPISTRALFAIIAGHTQHHLNILRDRYGIGA